MKVSSTKVAVVRGGKNSNPVPTQFARFDTSRAIIDRLKSEIVTDRDNYLLKQRERSTRAHNREIM